MARVRSPARDEAFEIYKKHNGNISNREISNTVNEDEKKIAVWKQRDKWSDKIKSVVQQNKKCCTTNVNNKKSNKKSSKEEPIADEVKEVLNNAELTDKQRLFCIYYIKYFNATKAYQKAYGCSNQVALVNGSRLLGNAKVKIEIEILKKNKLNRVMLSEDDIFQRYMDIAFTDITDFIEFGKKEVEFGEDKDGNPIMVEVNYVDFIDCKNVDGTLISEVSNGKDGVKIKLQDKMKALQWLSDRLDLIPTVDREKLENEKKKVQQAQEKIDYEKSKNSKSDKPIEILIKRKERD